MEVKQNFIAFVFHVPVKTVPLFFPIGKFIFHTLAWFETSFLPELHV